MKNAFDIRDKEAMIQMIQAIFITRGGKLFYSPAGFPLTCVNYVYFLHICLVVCKIVKNTLDALMSESPIALNKITGKLLNKPGTGISAAGFMMHETHKDFSILP